MFSSSLHPGFALPNTPFSGKGPAECAKALLNVQATRLQMDWFQQGSCDMLSSAHRWCILPQFTPRSRHIVLDARGLRELATSAGLRCSRELDPEHPSMMVWHLVRTVSDPLHMRVNPPESSSCFPHDGNPTFLSDTTLECQWMSALISAQGIWNFATFTGNGQD